MAGRTFSGRDSGGRWNEMVRWRIISSRSIQIIFNCYTTPIKLLQCHGAVASSNELSAAWLAPRGATPVLGLGAKKVPLKNVVEIK